MKHGSLFSGIGGFDLAAQWMGWENVFHCEIAEFPRKVLHHYWPNAISYENIIETDFTKHRGHIDIISGGFPCQPYSLAGKRLGKEDARHLWPEMLRTIREIQPRWVVGENVFGLVNWNGGLVFDEVQSDLEAEGYEVQAYVLPACAVNAPHRRDRVWFVAKNTMHSGCVHRGVKQEGTEIQEQRNTCAGDTNGVCTSKRPTPHATSKGREERQQVGGREDSEKNSAGMVNGIERFINDGISSNPSREGLSFEPCRKQPCISKQDATQPRRSIDGTYTTGSQWSVFPTQSPVCRRDDGFSSRLDGITFSKWRNESIKAYGNAVVPQVVFQIFKAIHEYENKY
jgi:DNA (cytosine-5)-methyltransferase 1